MLNGIVNKIVMIFSADNRKKVLENFRRVILQQMVESFK